MSGDGKRGVCQTAPSYRAHPRLYSTVRVPDHAHKTIDVLPKPRFNALRSPENHPNPLDLNGNRLHYVILKSPNLRLSDSVVLEHFPEKWTPVFR